jgi:hypothetical protein
MMLDIDLAQQSSSDDLPNETQNQVFPSLGNILRADVDDGTSDTFGRGDDDVVVLGDLEGVEFAFRGRLVEDSVVDGIRYRVVDEFTQNQTVCEWDGLTVNLQEFFRDTARVKLTSAFVKQLHGVGRDR